MSARNPFVVVAVGLNFEARLALDEGVAKVCCGRGAQLAVALATAIGPGCSGIISFGIAGGLDPKLLTGTCIVASSVIGANGVRIALPTNERWSQILLQSRSDAVHAPVLGIDAPVTEPKNKLRLFRQTGAAAVDMESHIAASIADSHGLPFAVLRVVADPGRQHVPQAALCGMRADGSLDAMAVLRALWRQPGDIVSMPSVARNVWVARAALTRVRHGLGRGFGLPDLG
jgi:adenosylhomocysteine nucleosidase